MVVRALPVPKILGNVRQLFSLSPAFYDGRRPPLLPKAVPNESVASYCQELEDVFRQKLWAFDNADKHFPQENNLVPPVGCPLPLGPGSSLFVDPLGSVGWHPACPVESPSFVYLFASLSAPPKMVSPHLSVGDADGGASSSDLVTMRELIARLKDCSDLSTFCTVLLQYCSVCLENGTQGSHISRSFLVCVYDLAEALSGNLLRCTEHLDSQSYAIDFMRSADQFLCVLQSISCLGQGISASIVQIAANLLCLYGIGEGSRFRAFDSIAVVVLLSLLCESANESAHAGSTERRNCEFQSAAQAKNLQRSSMESIARAVDATAVALSNMGRKSVLSNLRPTDSSPSAAVITKCALLALRIGLGCFFHVSTRTDTGECRRSSDPALIEDLNGYIKILVCGISEPSQPFEECERTGTGIPSDAVLSTRVLLSGCNLEEQAVLVLAFSVLTRPSFALLLADGSFGTVSVMGEVLLSEAPERRGADVWAVRDAYEVSRLVASATATLTEQFTRPFLPCLEHRALFHPDYSPQCSLTALVCDHQMLNHIGSPIGGMYEATRKRLDFRKEDPIDVLNQVAILSTALIASQSLDEQAWLAVASTTHRALDAIPQREMESPSDMFISALTSLLCAVAAASGAALPRQSSALELLRRQLRLFNSSNFLPESFVNLSKGSEASFGPPSWSETGLDAVFGHQGLLEAICIRLHGVLHVQLTQQPTSHNPVVPSRFPGIPLFHVLCCCIAVEIIAVVSAKSHPSIGFSLSHTKRTLLSELRVGPEGFHATKSLGATASTVVGGRPFGPPHRILRDFVDGGAFSSLVMMLNQWLREGSFTPSFYRSISRLPRCLFNILAMLDFGLINLPSDVADLVHSATPAVTDELYWVAGGHRHGSLCSSALDTLLPDTYKNDASISVISTLRSQRGSPFFSVEVGVGVRAVRIAVLVVPPCYIAYVNTCSEENPRPSAPLHLEKLRMRRPNAEANLDAVASVLPQAAPDGSSRSLARFPARRDRVRDVGSALLGLTIASAVSIARHPAWGVILS